MKWVWPIVVIAAIIVLIARYYSFSGNLSINDPLPKNTENSAGINLNNEEETQILEEPKTYTIEISSNGFSPEELQINKGDSVIFLGADEELHWPASNIHPTHRIYPGSGIEKCSTTEKDSLFDSCRSLNQGESFTFTFNQLGTWSYHDHLNGGLRGIIIVK